MCRAPLLFKGMHRLNKKRMQDQEDEAYEELMGEVYDMILGDEFMRVTGALEQIRLVEQTIQAARIMNYSFDMIEDVLFFSDEVFSVRKADSRVRRYIHSCRDPGRETIIPKLFS